MATVFTEIYRNNTWLNAESRSGPGSTVARGQVVGRALRELIAEFAVCTLLDAPCGDFNWMKEVALPGTTYLGVDIVRELIDRNQRCYGNDQYQFRCLDITTGPLPRADLIFCRDGLVHLSNTDVLKALAVFQCSGSRYLAATTFPGRTTNENIATGAWRPLNLEKAPFLLPPPLRLVSDGCPIAGYGDKAVGLWQLDWLQDGAA
jgi:hypothetical protein